MTLFIIGDTIDVLRDGSVVDQGHTIIGFREVPLDACGRTAMYALLRCGEAVSIASIRHSKAPVFAEGYSMRDLEAFADSLRRPQAP